MRVEKTHTYYVGTEGVLVHNACYTSIITRNGILVTETDLIGTLNVNRWTSIIDNLEEFDDIAFIRSKLSSRPDIALKVGTQSLNSGNGKGLRHLLTRHHSDFFNTYGNPSLIGEGELFPTGTTVEQIINGIEEVYSKGTRTLDPNKGVQIFEKRISLNGISENYRLLVDNQQNYIITFFKIGQ